MTSLIRRNLCSLVIRQIQGKDALLSRMCACSLQRNYSSEAEDDRAYTKSGLKKARTPTGKLDSKVETATDELKPAPYSESDAYKPFPNNKNPETGEEGGPRGPEPTRYGDWERKGRCVDF